MSRICFVHIGSGAYSIGRIDPCERTFQWWTGESDEWVSPHSSRRLRRIHLGYGVFRSTRS